MKKAVDVTISRLRRKVDDPFDTKLIRSVRGMGYVLDFEWRIVFDEVRMFETKWGTA